MEEFDAPLFFIIIRASGWKNPAFNCSYINHSEFICIFTVAFLPAGTTTTAHSNPLAA
jgi:hypothetical protein